MARKAGSKNRKSKKATKPSSKPGFCNKPFVGLKAKVPVVDTDSTSARTIEPMLTKKLPDDDKLIFSSAMAGVEPLKKRRGLMPSNPSTPPPPSSLEQEDQEVMIELRRLVDGQSGFSIHETDEAIEGLADGIGPSLLARLKAGEFSVQDHLDLHGLSRQEAKPKVDAFLYRALRHRMRCVLIVHGRGHRSKDRKPVLKPALKNWLLRSGMAKSILAFCTARVCDGGGGAIYILLKKAKRS